MNCSIINTKYLFCFLENINVDSDLSYILIGDNNLEFSNYLIKNGIDGKKIYFIKYENKYNLGVCVSMLIEYLEVIEPDKLIINDNFDGKLYKIICSILSIIDSDVMFIVNYI